MYYASLLLHEREPNEKRFNKIIIDNKVPLIIHSCKPIHLLIFKFYVFKCHFETKTNSPWTNNVILICIFIMIQFQVLSMLKWTLFHFEFNSISTILASVGWMVFKCIPNAFMIFGVWNSKYIVWLLLPFHYRRSTHIPINPHCIDILYKYV